MTRWKLKKNRKTIEIRNSTELAKLSWPVALLTNDSSQLIYIQIFLNELEAFYLLVLKTICGYIEFVSFFFCSLFNKSKRQQSKNNCNFSLFIHIKNLTIYIKASVRKKGGKNAKEIFIWIIHEKYTIIISSLVLNI